MVVELFNLWIVIKFISLIFYFVFLAIMSDVYIFTYNIETEYLQFLLMS